MTRRRTTLAIAIAAAIVGLGACGDDTPAQLTGAVSDPLPVIGEVALPDATRDLEPFALQAESGGLLLVYFGYTNCPDFCPTTMSDAKLARTRLDDPERVALAMITVDPDRDFVERPELCDDGIVLSCYVRSFADDAHALGTDDPALLQRAATPFGAAYNVTTSGDAVVVEHTTYLYAVDDQGRIVVTWPFGTAIDDLASDLTLLLDRADAT
jgi:protein SCO1